MSPPAESTGSLDEGALEAYRQKRSADRTTEPFGRANPALAGVFVLQKHAASRLHYDLRLEIDGVLKSWVIPKGPSLDPEEKRLAIQTEDHPIEYQDYEGVIPEGNYGAGAMIVWDRGTWVPIEGDKVGRDPVGRDPVGRDPVGLDKGKLLFELRGYKLHGVWTLFKTSKQQEGNEWLLMKKPDGWARRGDEADLAERSVLSGLTVEELREGGGRCAELRRELAGRGLAEEAIDAAEQRVMLAQPRARPFSRDGWIFELKYDGFRLLAAKTAGRPRLFYRHGGDATDLFPDVARAIAALPVKDLVLDGEVVVVDGSSRPSFQLLQQRTQLKRALDIQQAAARLPATYFSFDLLQFEGHDLRTLPLVERKQYLARILPAAGPLRYCDHIEKRGVDFFASVETMGLEGIVAKKADSKYRAGRSSSWQKIRIDRRDDFVIVGYSRSKGVARNGLGALHLACYESDGAATLIYAGRVGTGFSIDNLELLVEELDRRRRAKAAFSGNVPTGDQHVWVEPELVCEVRYKELTRDHHLRHPSFMGLRPDKEPAECISPLRRGEAPLAEPTEAPSAAPKIVRLTNPDKIFWPDEGYTKADLFNYYGEVAEAMLPYLRQRPLVLTRYPDGINGKSFFQKNAPQHSPDWIRTETIWSEHSQRQIEYYVCEDVESLQFIANLGAITLHLWSSTLDSLQRPDWCILDLDPKQAPFGDVVKVARAVRRLCDAIELPSFVKTSGSTGLHILLPLARQCTYEQSRLLAELISRIVVHRHPKIATITRVIQKRQGRVYLDYGQNGHGRLLVAPFSVRAKPGATVSAPLRWREVNAQLRLDKFDIKSLPKRLRRLREDPFHGVLDTTPDLERSLAMLAEHFGSLDS